MEPRAVRLLPLSAPDPERLRGLAAAMVQFLAEAPDMDLDDLCATAARERPHLASRAAVPFRARGDLVERLRALTAGARRPPAGRPKVVLVFGGGGTEWAGMGLDLLAHEPAFAGVLRDCDRALRDLGGWSLLDELRRPEASSGLHRTELALPAICAVQLALAAQLRSWGIEPEAVVGHSLGEVAAACAAGAFAVEDAMRITFHQGRLLQAATGSGTSLAVGLPAEEVAPILAGHPGRAWLAAVNSPRSVVLSGDPEAMGAIAADLRRRGAFQRPLGIEYAMHSPRLEPYREELVRSLAALRPRPGRVAVASGIAGGALAGEAFGAAHWGRLLHDQVRFSSALEGLIRGGCDTFVEIGPHPVLHVPLSQCLAAAGREGLVLGSLRRLDDGRLGMLETLAALYGAGCEVAWAALHPMPRRPVRLPDPPSAPAPAGADADGGEQAPLLDALAAAYPGERERVLREHVRTRVAELAPGAADLDTGLFELGMTSLGALRLADLLTGDLAGRVAVPPSLAFDHPTVAAIAAFLEGALFPAPAPGPATAPAGEPIAVIGLGCRFPGGAAGPDAFWRLLRDGVDATSDVPPGRWDVDALHDPDPGARGRITARRGGFLDAVDRFDAAFFGISPREAESMDPQQRLLLEVAWEALEHAGLAPDGLAGSRTGVFVGLAANDYALLQAGDLAGIDGYSGTGTLFSVAAGRVSYVLGLQGPCLAVDTACSASLVAVHLACQGLRGGECDLALAGGSHVILSPELGVFLSRTGALAPDGRCKTFDAAANGFGRGEGCGVVVLKRLSDALAAGDEVLAVIRGSAVNSDGRSSGLTVPNGAAQEALLRSALAAAGVAPAGVGYVEAHGTGTSLGDPIELRALAAVLGPGRPASMPLLVGSVKTNLGHLEASAGIAGLIKVVLALRHREIPPHLNLRTPTPLVPWDLLPIRVPVERTAWRPAEAGRVAGVSAFGIGGTNAHVVVEEAPPVARPAHTHGRPVHLLTLSAAGPDALRELAGRHARHLDEHPSLALADVAFTLNAGRAHLPHRLGLLATDAAGAASKLGRWARGEAVAGLLTNGARAGEPPRVAFVFTGQGAQYAGMGEALLRDLPVFREAIEECDRLLAGRLDPPLRAVLLRSPGQPSLVDRTEYAQPALFAVQYALSRVWRAWGVEPSAVLGHSLGEYAAACVSGVLPLADALALVVRRGALMGTPPGPGRLAKLEALVSTVGWGPARVPFVSTVTGGPVTGEELAHPAYWRRNARGPVRFLDAVTALVERGFDAVVEIGPHPVLCGVARRGGLDPDPGRPWLPSLRSGGDAWTDLLTSLATLYLAGAPIDWAAVDGPFARGRPALPTYPFQRQRYWRSPGARAAGPSGRTGHPLLGERLRSPALRGVVHQRPVEPAGGALSPATWLAMAAAAMAGDRSLALTGVSFPDPMLGGRRPAVVQTIVAAGRDSLQVVSGAGTGEGAERWRVHLTGVLRVEPDEPHGAPPSRDPAGETVVPVAAGRALGPEVFEALTAALDLGPSGAGERVLASVDRLRPGPPPATDRLWCHVTARAPGVADATVRDESGATVAELTGIRVTAGGGVARLLYELTWRPEAAAGTHAPESVLVVADRGGTGAALAEALRARGGDCRLVDDPDAGRVAGLVAGTRPRELVFLPALDARVAADAAGEAVAGVQALGYDRALALVRALGAMGLQDPPRLHLVTRGAQRTAAEREVDVAGATLWGLGRVIRLEYPELACTLVDLEAGPADPARESAALLAALGAGDGEPQVAIRGGERRVARLVPLEAGPAPALGEGTYLVTGGLGGIGIRVAGRLAERGVRSLVLLGRGGGSAEAREAVEALRRSGVDVVCARGDVSRAGDVARALHGLHGRPPLRGVVHAAGTLDDAMLRDQTPERLRTVLAGKAVGAWHLHRLTEGVALDHFVLFSSLAGVVGSAGQANYAAANAFLDALAQHRRARGLPAMTIAWGAWQGTGMAADLDQRRLTERGILGMSAGQALAAFDAVLESGATQVVASPVDWNALERADRWRGLLGELVDELGPARAPDRHPRPDTLGEVVAANGDRQRILVGIWEEVLRMSPVGVTDNFFQLGGDSILALDVVRGARRAGVRLAERQLFEHPTIADLAAVADAAPGAPAGPAPEPAADLVDADLSPASLRRLLARIDRAGAG